MFVPQSPCAKPRHIALHTPTTCMQVSAGAAGPSPYNLTCEVFGVPAGLYGDSSATAGPLYNPRFSLFNALLVNVLNWGDTYMQTS